MTNSQLELAKRQALEYLADCPNGCTAGMLQHRGLDLAAFVTLVAEGLADAMDQFHSNPPGLVVTRYWVTQAGRDFLKIH